MHLDALDAIGEYCCSSKVFGKYCISKVFGHHGSLKDFGGKYCWSSKVFSKYYCCTRNPIPFSSFEALRLLASSNVSSNWGCGRKTALCCFAVWRVKTRIIIMPATTTTTTVLRDYTTTTTVLRYNTSSITTTTTKLRQLRRQRQDTAMLSQLQLQLCYYKSRIIIMPATTPLCPATTTTLLHDDTIKSRYWKVQLQHLSAVLRDNPTITTGLRQLRRQRQDTTKLNQLKLLSTLLIPATNLQERYSHYVMIFQSLECSLM